MPIFHSALLKIQRASSQADDLYDQVMRLYGSGDDPAYRVVFERDADPRKWRAVFRLVKQPPDNWPILLGEIIHNLRSALDHMVYEASAPDENGQPLRGTEYPIFSEEPRYATDAPYKIRGLNDATRALIKKHQPFARTKPNFVPYLWALHELAITDKHRLLNVASVMHSLAGMNILQQPGETPWGNEHRGLVTNIIGNTNAPLKDGAEFYTFSTDEPLPADSQVHVDAQLVVKILWDDTTPCVGGLSVFDTIKGMGRWVGGLRNEFIKLNPDPS